MRVVIDCNVVISAGMTPNGTCQQTVINAFKNYDVVVTDLILKEYKTVSARSCFAKFNTSMRELIRIIENSSIKIDDEELDGISLPDPDDLIYLFAAINSKSKFLITGNTKDFPLRHYNGVDVVMPKEFIIKNQSMLLIEDLYIEF